jgi:transposase
MSNLLKKVIGVDVGAKFLTVSFNDHCDKDQVHNIENNQRSILAFLKKISTEDYASLLKRQVTTAVVFFISPWKKVLNPA